MSSFALALKHSSALVFLHRAAFFAWAFWAAIIQCPSTTVVASACECVCTVYTANCCRSVVLLDEYVRVLCLYLLELQGCMTNPGSW